VGNRALMKILFNKKGLFWVPLLVILLSCRMAFSGENQLLMRDLGNRQITYAGFLINSDRMIHVKAIGAGAESRLTRTRNYQQDRFNMFAYAWIINAQTREMVWRMTPENTRHTGWAEWNRIFNGDVKLKKGRYEVYFAAIEPSFFFFNGGFLSFGKLLHRIFSGDEDWQEESKEWMVRISNVDEILEARAVRKQQRTLKDRMVATLTNLHDEERAHTGFALTKPLKVEIYGLGEGYKGRMFDYGWLINADTREEIWKMREDESDYAGGAIKNRLFHVKLKLESGNYLLYYRLDANHSSQEWNANPPYDPFFWGISIRPVSAGYEPSIVKNYSESTQKPLISMIRVGDYAYREKGLLVKRPAKIRIYALGEGRDGQMFDYGWISRVSDGKIVWKMEYAHTQHAGGASKNRLFNGVITLQKGKYVVHYQTDDSHSYEEWNAGKPDNPKMWGITIYPVNKDWNAFTVLGQSQMRNKNIIARLVRVGDDEHVRKQFHLNKTTRIRIYCIGEGDEDEMYDYGWIENLTEHRTVWRMRYKNTEHAGGARKNRMIDTTITLPSGVYQVHFRSDGSHSYYDWNSAPPDDPQNWGITLYKVNK